MKANLSMNLWPGSIEKIENDNTDIISNLSLQLFPSKKYLAKSDSSSIVEADNPKLQAKVLNSLHNNLITV